MKNKILLSVFIVFIIAAFSATWFYCALRSNEVSTDYVEFYQNAEELGKDFNIYPILKYDLTGEHTTFDMEIDNAPIIIRGRHNGVRTYYSDCSVQEVVVEKVIKGAPAEIVGKTVQIESQFYFEPSHDKRRQSFVSSRSNHMKDGHSYLIFLWNHGSTMNDPDGIKNPEIYATPLAAFIGYLDYKNQDDVALDSFLTEEQLKKVRREKYEEISMPYRKMEQNEFFVIDKQTLDKMYVFKREVFKRFGESMEN